jgi:hypothetical protein
MTPNLFTNLPRDLPKELFTTLLQAPGVRVERKSIRPGVELEAWLRRARASKHPEIARVLSTRMPKDHEPGGLLNPFKSPRGDASLKRALNKLREQLR